MSKQRVLVVDDDPGIRLAVSLKLRTSGYDVSEATDGAEALEFFADGVVDIVVTDVGMPRMDGYEFAAALQESESTRSIPVIILTAQEMAVPDDVLPTLGRHHFLTKPFSPRELVKVVGGMLEAESS